MRASSSKPNLRNQQRVDVELEVTVSNPAGEELRCEAANLSRTGVMLRCNLETVRQLIPGQTAPAPGQWIQVSTRFAVPVVAAQTVSVCADGHIVHLRRVSRDEFHLGVQFSEFRDNGYDYLDQYVSRLLATSLG
ncbi:MAG: PilZ domain-containing protein [Marinobacter sp.]|uniref:PilZ domain-containing protein n=1 Tax=Marinobacter sp. TaxID=50741 RepID=UPI00299DE56E|nr:PilZ domain-containing protein [Marinobacter sp.]MDX1756745.1 PilZ domain-containing protein [Marinobacter sp.]